MGEFEPSKTLQKVAHLVKVVCCSALVFALLGAGFSWLRPAKATTTYQGTVLISLAKVQRQKVANTTLTHYAAGDDLAPLFNELTTAPQTTKKIQQKLTKAGLAAQLAGTGNQAERPQKVDGLVQVRVTSQQPQAAVKGANLAAQVAVQQFKQRYHLRHIRILVPATQAKKQVRTTSRGELILKSTFIGILLGFLWIFARELWQVHVTSK